MNASDPTDIASATASVSSRKRHGLWTRWHDQLYAQLPPAQEVKERNVAITAAYARFYKTCPDLFKWAGVAAFASHRVGLALTPYAAIAAVEDAVADLEGHRPDLEPDIDLLRQTNNQVFRDMGWAHAAFMAPGGGFDAIRELLQDQPQHAFMLEGFRILDQARQLLDGSQSRRRQVRKLVWYGNFLLLKQEQFITVQPQFEKITPAFRVFLSVATAMDFSADHWLIDWLTHTSFPWFMYTRGVPTLVRTRSLPDIGNRDHRWLWASKSVLRIWRWVDRWDPSLKGRIDHLIALAR